MSQSQSQTVQLVASRYTFYYIRGQIIFAGFKATVLNILVL
jgi:hypothetical protein